MYVLLEYLSLSILQATFLFVFYTIFMYLYFIYIVLCCIYKNITFIMYVLFGKGTKCFLKESVQYLPVVGWSFWLMEFPMLKRDWEKDKSCLAESSARLADYPINMLVS